MCRLGGLSDDLAYVEYFPTTFSNQEEVTMKRTIVLVFVAMLAALSIRSADSSAPAGTMSFNLSIVAREGQLLTSVVNGETICEHRLFHVGSPVFLLDADGATLAITPMTYGTMSSGNPYAQSCRFNATFIGIPDVEIYQIVVGSYYQSNLTADYLDSIGWQVDAELDYPS